MASKSKLWYLSRMDLFRHLNMDAMKVANQISVMTELKKRTPVYLPGDPADKIYLIKRGVVKISTLTEEGKEIVLAFLHPGDVFGELAVVDPSPRDHYAEIYEDALICIFARNDFLDFMKRYPDLAFQVTKLLGLRVRRYPIESRTSFSRAPMRGSPRRCSTSQTNTVCKMRRAFSLR